MANANPSLNAALDGYRKHGVAYSDQGVTTIDTVVQKTAMTLGLLVLTALATWFYLAPVDGGSLPYDRLQQVTAVSFVASLAALGLSFWISFSRKVRPAAILLFAALEGVVIGAFSKFATLQVGSLEPVVGAVVGTVFAFASTLFVYKFFNIEVTARMRRNVTIAVFAMVGVSLFDLVLSFFGASFGVNGFGPVGILFSVLGIAVALFMLITDFDAVERAIEYRLPEVESWRLAFGLTVTLVWLYVNMLRILSALRN